MRQVVIRVSQMLMYSKIIFYWNADFEASMKQTWNSAFLKVPGDADAAYLQTRVAQIYTSELKSYKCKEEMNEAGQCWLVWAREYFHSKKMLPDRNKGYITARSFHIFQEK